MIHVAGVEVLERCCNAFWIGDITGDFDGLATQRVGKVWPTSQTSHFPILPTGFTKISRLKHDSKKPRATAMVCDTRCYL